MNQSKIMWFSFVMSTVIYLVVLFTLAPELPQHSYEESLRGRLTMTLYAAAFVVFLAGFILPGRIEAPARVRMILRMAFFEACAINGLLAAFFAQDWRVYLAPWVLALLGFVSAFPKENELAA